MPEAVQQQVGVGQRALTIVRQVRVRYQGMPAGPRTRLIAGGAILLAVVAGMVWYVGRPDYRVLFSGLEGKDVQQVAQELAAAGIPFQMTPDGTGVQVPAEVLDKARMEVASKGMPQTGRLGFELFDKPNWVGSEFDERVNYQRALEGELEHTIATIGMVRSARVHLVLPQQSLFTSEEKLAKASVVLKLRRAGLDPEQTESIRNLVAGAVENLSPAQVTLVDADGRADLQARGHTAQAADVERALETKLVSMLEPLAGAGNVRATVSVSYDEGSEEHTDEVYDPDQTVALTSQKTEQTSGGSRVAAGVPGTASNAPAAAPAGAVQGSDKAAAPGTPPLLQKEGLPVYPQNGSAGQSVKEESGTYAVTRHVTHTEAGPGRVRRVTAAVVVNDRMVADAGTKGASPKTVWKPRSPEEMRRLESLAKAAVGFDQTRGDAVVMENVTFSSNMPETPAPGVDKVLEQARGLLGTQPGVLKTAVTGLLGLVLVLVVLRPVARQVAVSLKPGMLLADGSVVQADEAIGLTGNAPSRGELGAVVGSAGLGAGVEAAEMTDERRAAVLFEEVSAHIKSDPTRSTRLLESWIATDGEE